MSRPQYMIDPMSETWLAVRDELRDRIERHRTNLEQDLPAEVTAGSRHVIRELRELLGLVEPSKLPSEPQKDTYT